MAEISIESRGPKTFRVTVDEEGSSTTHTVTVDLGQKGISDEHLVESSFRFLLDREPKESILSEFNLSEIERHFGEYHDRIGDYL